MSLIKNTWSNLREQPVLSGVTIIGTTMAIFLIMIVVMLNEVKVVPFAPESNRDRLLYADYGSVYEIETGPERSRNGAMSEYVAKGLYKDLETAEIVSIYDGWLSKESASRRGQSSVKIDLRRCDADFFGVFDYTFVDGKPFTGSDLEAGIKCAVITESTARRIFGRTDVIGEEIRLSQIPYTVSGVVKDVSTLATKAYADVWIPYAPEHGQGLQGMKSAVILAKKGVDLADVKAECDRRFEKFNEEIRPTGMQMMQRGRPYNQEKQSVGVWANVEPEVEPVRREHIMILLILLIVPAINLTGMTQSRLRQRRAEIGVKRAFGASRVTIIREIIAENIVVTLAAGVIGFVLSVIFANVFSSELFTTGGIRSLANEPTVDLSILIHFSTFMWALLFCFLLNVISTGVPAWQASRTNVVNAIKG